MANFSSFFPVAAAGGGGGFTKMKKISSNQSTNETTDKTSGSLTINPATDLGLSDGDSIGFLLAGGNATGVLRGTAIISDASTDLVCTPGLSSGTASTITGGLTLTSADGNTDASFPRRSTTFSGGYAGYALDSAGGMGVDGYGVGNQITVSGFTHGNGGYGKDGAILLFY